MRAYDFEHPLIASDSMLPTPALTQSIGKKLMAARTERGLQVEDVAFKTHIPAARIRDLENDDFSNFANLTYAKGFLKIYSGYLNLDLDDYLDQFNTSEFANISGHDYIQSANTGMTSLSMAVAPSQHEGMRGTLWGIVLVLALLIGIPVYYWTRPPEPPPVPPPVSAPPPTVVDPPKAKIIDTPAEEKTPADPEANAVTPTAPAVREIEIKSAEPASIRAKVVPEDPTDAPSAPRNDVTNPPAPDAENPASNKPATGGVQIRKALSEIAGDPPANR